MYTLHELPVHLTRYGLALSSNPSADEKCIACWRQFDTVDDPSNLLERPCRAVQFETCGHVIGSECLKEMLRRGIGFCPQCNGPITEPQNPIPRWVTYLLWQKTSVSLAPTALISGARVRARDQSEAALKQFDEAHKRLFSGNLGIWGGLKL